MGVRVKSMQTELTTPGRGLLEVANKLATGLSWIHVATW